MKPLSMAFSLNVNTGFSTSIWSVNTVNLVD